MMRLNKLLVIALMLFSCSCETSSTVDPVYENYFIKYYGKDGEQVGVDFVVNDDGSMILLGNSYFPAEVVSPYIAKVDPKGNILWQRQCGGNIESAVDLELIKKGPYQGSVIVATNVGGEASSRIRLIRISQSGQSIDSLIVPLPVGVTKQIAKGITSFAIDDGYAVTGYTDGNLTSDPQMPIPPADQADIFAQKISESFQGEADMLLAQGGEHVGAGVRVFDALFNNVLNYLVFGYSDRPAPDDYELNFEIISPDPITNSQLFRKVAGTENQQETAVAVIQTPPSLGEGYLMVGTSTNNSGASDIYLAKFSKGLEAKSLDQKIPLGKRLECVAVANAEPIGYVIVANEITENDNKNIFLIKVKFDGSVIWSRSFGTSEGNDTAGAVAALPDGRIAILGTMELQTQRKMALMLINPEGNFTD